MAKENPEHVRRAVENAKKDHGSEERDTTLYGVNVTIGPNTVVDDMVETIMEQMSDVSETGHEGL